MARQRRVLIGFMVAVGLLAAACGKDVAANDAEVGQCTNVDLSGGVGEIDSVDCAEPHAAEVFALFDLEGDDFPGSAEVTQLGGEGCAGDRFTDYVGVEYAESEIEVGPVTPTEETWNEADDRTVICFAISLDGSDLEGSVKGINR